MALKFKVGDVVRVAGYPSEEDDATSDLPPVGLIGVVYAADEYSPNDLPYIVKFVEWGTPKQWAYKNGDIPNSQWFDEVELEEVSDAQA